VNESDYITSNTAYLDFTALSHGQDSVVSVSTMLRAG